MLSDEMKTLISNHRAGMVATVNDQGAPMVSPKATFVIIDETTLAFGNIRSPNTLANLKKKPAVEVCFIDVITRKAVRVTGNASIIRKADADADLKAAFEKDWSDYLAYMSAFVKIDVQTAQLIKSPAYDLGITEEELRRTNLEKLNAL